MSFRIGDRIWCIHFDDETLLRVLEAAAFMERRMIMPDELRTLYVAYDGYRIATLIAWACHPDPRKAGIGFIHAIMDPEVLPSAIQAFHWAFLARFGKEEAPLARWLADVRARRETKKGRR